MNHIAFTKVGTITLPSPLFGDSDTVTLPYSLHPTTRSLDSRFVDSNWPGKNDFKFEVDLPKCSPLYSTMGEVNTWLLTNNGKIVDYYEDAVKKRSGILIFEDCVEKRDSWILSFILVEVF